MPELAQSRHPPNATYNGLVSLNDDQLTKKVGKNMLIATTGCKKKKHPYKVDLTFIDERGHRRAATISDTATAKCSKKYSPELSCLPKAPLRRGLRRS